MRAGDGSNLLERVEGAEDRRASRGIDEEGRLPRVLGGDDEPLQLGGDHGAIVADGDGDEVAGAEADHLCCFLEGIVAVRGGEDDEVVGAIAIGLGGGVERVAGDDEGAQVAAAAALRGEAAGVGAGEAVEVGKALGDCFFDYGEGGGDLVYVHVGVERCEDELGDHANLGYLSEGVPLGKGGQTYGVGAGVQLIQEALVPRVNAVLQDLLDNIQEGSFAASSLRKLQVEQLHEFRGLVRLDQCGSGASALAMARMFHGRFVICPANKRDDQLLDGI